MYRRILVAALSALLLSAPALALAADATTATSTTVVVIDASRSMAGANLRTVIDTTSQLVQSLPPTDAVGLVALSGPDRVVVKPAADHAATVSALGALTARGNTALYDGILTAIGLFSGSTDCSLVIVGDGRDTNSVHTLTDVVRAMRGTTCTVRAIAVQPSPNGLATMTRLAKAGHGSVVAAAGTADLVAALGVALPTPTPTPSVTPSATTTETPATPSPQPTPTATAPTSRTTPTVLLLGLALLFGVSVFAFIMLLIEGSDRSSRRRVEKLIEAYAMQRSKPEEEKPRTFLETLEDAIRPLLARGGRAERLEVLLDGAGVNRSAEQWTLIRIAAVVAITVVLTFASGAAPVGLIVGLGLGLPLPQLWLKMRRRKRSKSFEAGLPDALMLIASSLRSGFSLDQAIVAAAEQSDNEVSTEFKRAVQEMRIGVPLEDALERAAVRIDSDDFAWVVTALRIQRRSGGNLSQLLITVSKTVRQRAEIAREVKALTAEGRLSTYVLMGLPIGMFVFLLITQPSYLTPLWQTSLGWVISGVGIAMLSIGWVIMNRLVKVDV